MAPGKTALSLGSYVGDTSIRSQPTATSAHDLQRLPHREATDLRRTGAARERRVDAIDVEAQIDRGFAIDGGPDLSHQWREPLVPDLMRRHDGNALLQWPVEVFCRVTAATQPDLPNLAVLQQAFFHRIAKRRAI